MNYLDKWSTYIHTCCWDSVVIPRLCVCWLHCPVDTLACKDFVSKVCLFAGTIWEEGVVWDAISTGLVAANKQRKHNRK